MTRRSYQMTNERTYLSRFQFDDISEHERLFDSLLLIEPLDAVFRVHEMEVAVMWPAC